MAVLMLFTGRWLSVWQFGPPTQAERTLDEAIALAKSYGFQGLAVKALDGLTWMGHVQAGVPDAIRSVAQIAEQRGRCEAAGLRYAVWTNPLFGSNQFLDDEADLYAAAGIAAGCMMWDSEPYQHFWGAWRPAGAAWRLVERFRQQAPDCVNVWQPDPRPGRLTELRPEEWAPHMNVYAPQTYWSTFGTNPQFELDRGITQCAELGVAEYAPTLPGEAQASDLSWSMRHLTDAATAAVIVWRMGSAGDSQLQAVGHGPLFEPEPPGPCAELRRGLEARYAERPYRPIRKRELRAMLDA